MWPTKKLRVFCQEWSSWCKYLADKRKECHIGEKQLFKAQAELQMFRDRYYRFDPDQLETLLERVDKAKQAEQSYQRSETEALSHIEYYEKCILTIHNSCKVLENYVANPGPTKCEYRSERCDFCLALICGQAHHRVMTCTGNCLKIKMVEKGNPTQPCLFVVCTACVYEVRRFYRKCRFQHQTQFLLKYGGPAVRVIFQHIPLMPVINNILVPYCLPS